MQDLTETHEQPMVTRNLEAPDPPGNPAENTFPRQKQEADPERLERALEELDRTIAT